MGLRFGPATAGPTGRAGRNGRLRSRGIGLGVAAAAVLCGGLVVDAGAATGPPPPKTHGGATATVVLSGGISNVTSMAWGDGAMFAGDSGSSETKPNGGLYVVDAGTATKLKTPLLFVGGLAWHDGALYASGGVLKGRAPSWQIQKFSGWDGTSFAKEQVLYTAPAGFAGFNGIAFGPAGRLYVGVSLEGDHGPAAKPYGYDVLSMTAAGKDLKVFASGMRQPWQMAYAGGSSLFVSDLGQDGPKAVEKQNPPDFLLKVKAGDNYGFPDCNWTAGSPCSTDAKPFKFFPTHSSIMGLAVVKQTLYMTSFVGIGGKGGAALYSTGVSGGKVTPVVTGIAGTADALAAHDGDLYIGGSAQKGFIYQVKP
jgi:glucose/arabinose dehydrogenase